MAGRQLQAASRELEETQEKQIAPQECWKESNPTCFQAHEPILDFWIPAL